MIAIVSDIHGNLPALRAVLEKIDSLNCERIISLGDITGYYAQPAECIQLLRERNAIQLLGNHDQYLISGSGCPRSSTVSKLLKYQELAVSNEQKIFLSKLKSRYDEGIATFVHGGWDDPIDQYIYRVQASLFPAPFQFYFSGHTHVQCRMNLEDGRVYCNPGSVGQPRDGDSRAAFALFDGGVITLFRVEYKIEDTITAMRLAGYHDDRLWLNLYEGAQIGGRVDKVLGIKNQGLA